MPARKELDDRLKAKIAELKEPTGTTDIGQEELDLLVEPLMAGPTAAASARETRASLRLAPPDNHPELDIVAQGVQAYIPGTSINIPGQTAGEVHVVVTEKDGHLSGQVEVFGDDSLGKVVTSKATEKYGGPAVGTEVTKAIGAMGIKEPVDAHLQVEAGRPIIRLRRRPRVS